MPIFTQEDIANAYEGRAVAARYVGTRFDSELNRLLHERQVRAVLDSATVGKAKKALEIAPGPGRITRDVRLAGELVCLELNEGMIDEGRKACDDSVWWVQGSGFDLPFGEEFDLLYSFRFIRHFHLEDRRRLYAQIHRVLKPQGLLVFDAVNRRVSGPLREADPGAYPIYDKLYGDTKEVTEELEDAGFVDVQLKPVQRWYGSQYRAQILLGPRSRFLCRLAIRALERMRQGPALEWIVTCRRA